jgi:hypothetical protein
MDAAGVWVLTRKSIRRTVYRVNQDATAGSADVWTSHQVIAFLNTLSARNLRIPRAVWRTTRLIFDSHTPDFR